MNNPFCYTPSPECDAAFRSLLQKLDRLKTSSRHADRRLIQELSDGKMLGVLIAADDRGVLHTLYAFSGQIAENGFLHEGFVEPVFDYLQPSGHFKIHEAHISNLNREITLLEQGDYALAASKLASEKMKGEKEIEAFREKCRLSKIERDAKRESCREADDTLLDQLIRQSQFEKAELRRLKKRIAEQLTPYEQHFNAISSRLAALKEQRHSASEQLQDWLFSNFRLLNARGEWRTLRDIFADTPMRIPPSGAGECCAPKLLHAAFKRRLRPISIAEYWYGKPKEGEIRTHTSHYPACRGKCLPILTWMLQGLKVEPPLDNEATPILPFRPKILFQCEEFCVVEKPAGMLSVPGKGAAISVQDWLIEQFGVKRGVRVAHRLDQDTSGLMIATFGPSAYKEMQSLFATRKIHKSYIALLEGDWRQKQLPQHGNISLPLLPDWLDRPRQRVDTLNGKEALTEYEFLDVADGRSRVVLHPLTGRTHQLRVHAASPDGLGMPIVGDRLYAPQSSLTASRLHLHAAEIEFTYPPTGEHYYFHSSAAPF